MPSRGHPTKGHIELTTLSLLRGQGEWKQLGEHLPEGSVLIVVPMGDAGTWKLLLRVARRFRATGREVRVYYCPEG
jgi:hypothetical protein